MKVIVISGHAQSGKDTTAGFIKEELTRHGFRVQIMHYADLLKFICRSYFDWNGNKDENGRHILQYVGTDIIRKERPDYWVDFISSLLVLFNGVWDYVLIPDARFPNEVDVMKKYFNGTHVRVVRLGFTSELTEEQKAHPSETALDDTIPDVILYNSGTLESFKAEVIRALTDIIKD